MRIGTFYEYKGKIGTIEISKISGRYYGKLLGIKNDIFCYGANNIEDLYEEFKKTVDRYLCTAEPLTPISEWELKVLLADAEGCEPEEVDIWSWKFEG